MLTNYYEKNAQGFVEDTLKVDMSAIRVRFIEHLPSNGLVLDAGCGAGRDIKAFLEMGFEVEAFDASSAMVDNASKYGSIEVRQSTFQDVVLTKKYDGIWCCASLLHVPKSQHSEILSKFADAMRLGSVIYLSFKWGKGEREVDGRFFADHTDKSLIGLLEASEKLEVVDVWDTRDLRPGRETERWINALARRIE